MRLAESYATVRPCATSAGFEARPRQQLNFRLDDVERALRAAGIAILRNAAGIVLLVAVEGCEATVFPSGKLLLKTTDEAVAQRAADRIVAALPG
jgi:hypothetical protein